MCCIILERAHCAASTLFELVAFNCVFGKIGV